jgi:CRP/FNR family cyclic AMP-dependent transcriptional regulator
MAAETARDVLTERELRLLAAAGTVKTFPRHAVIVTEGDESDSLYVILSGRVKVFLADESGKEVVLGTQGPGEYFGEMVLDGAARSASVTTLERCRFVVIQQAKVRAFLREQPEFAVRMIEKLIRRVRVLTASVRDLSLMDVYGRVARLLLELAQERDGKLVVEERLTQQEVAARIGASREMVSRILKDLRLGGYIEVTRQRITICRIPPRHW